MLGARVQDAALHHNLKMDFARRQLEKHGWQDGEWYSAATAGLITP